MYFSAGWSLWRKLCDPPWHKFYWHSAWLRLWWLLTLLFKSCQCQCSTWHPPHVCGPSLQSDGDSYFLCLFWWKFIIKAVDWRENRKTIKVIFNVLSPVSAEAPLQSFISTEGCLSSRLLKFDSFSVPTGTLQQKLFRPERALEKLTLSLCVLNIF